MLELSRDHMFKFYYNYIKKEYPGNKSSLIYMDTDSYLLEVETEDIYLDQIRNSEWFDFSEYPPNSEIFQKAGLNGDEIYSLMEKNRKKLG